jgi:hypothetical protein
MTARSLAAGLGDGAIGALDGSRRWLWRLAARTSAGRACARDRSMRILALGLGHIGVALALAALAPGLLLLLGPLVLGVPHVVADLRYLVVRGPASLRGGAIIAIIVPLAAMTGFGVIEVMGGSGDPAVEIAFGFAAIGTAVAVAPGRVMRRMIVGVVAAALAVPAVMFPEATMIVLLFGHNFIALAIWCGFTRATVRLAHRALVVGAALIGVGLIAIGVFDRATGVAVDGRAWGGEGIARLPFAEGIDPVFAYRLVVGYAFLQALHYVVWLRLIPSTQSPSPAASTFKKSLTNLRADFGLALIAIAAATIAVPLLAGFVDAERVRDGYLSLVLFHAWLELAVIAYVVVTRERLGEAR